MRDILGTNQDRTDVSSETVVFDVVKGPDTSPRAGGCRICQTAFETDQSTLCLLFGDGNPGS